MANVNEYGLFQLLDLGLLDPNQQARTIDRDLLTSAVLYTTAQHNADVAAMLRTFAVTTTEYQAEFQTQAASRNQPLDENGRSIPVKPPVPYTVGFPIEGSGNAVGANYVTRVQMTARHFARQLAQMLRGDYNWVRDHILGALFQNVGYNFRDPTGRGTLAVKTLANGDAVNFYRQTTGLAAADTHYLAQAAGIADATNPYPTIKTELLEHPDNGGEVIAFIASDLVTTTEALAEFRPADLDPDITIGSETTRLTGTLGVQLPRYATLLGKTDSGVWIVEWPEMPSTYIIATTTDGERPLARRQFPEAELQGFRAAGEREDFPYWENQWIRFEGYGAFNRVGAVVYRIGNAAYAIPTNYGMPMP